ncbi:hypothetical protein AAVH_00349 [Aphelenchoides avenae]|nr:hypothetical protein AAVH_00349 [Aphelenchus avenae]
MSLSGLLASVRKKFGPGCNVVAIPDDSPDTAACTSAKFSSASKCLTAEKPSPSPKKTPARRKLSVVNVVVTASDDEDDDQLKPRQRLPTLACLSRSDRIKQLLELFNHEPDEPVRPEEQGCVICCERRASVRAYPCGHQVFCRKCGVTMIQHLFQAGKDRMHCIVCRAEIAVLRHRPGRR